MVAREERLHGRPSQVDLRVAHARQALLHPRGDLGGVGHDHVQGGRRIIDPQECHLAGTQRRAVGDGVQGQER